MTLEYDRIIVELASANDGIVTWDNLRASGIGDRAIRNRINGLLQPIARGVYMIGDPTERAWLRAALTATPGGVVAGLSAAKLHGLPTVPPQIPTILAPHGTTIRGEIDAVHHRQTRWLPPEDQTERNGFPVTSVERTLCDLATKLFRRQLRHAVEWSITENKMSVESFQACVRGFARRGRPGSTAVRIAAIDLLNDEPIVASELERRAVELFRRAHLPRFEAQFRPPWYDGVTGIVDVAWPRHRLIVELDGRRWHSTSAAMTNDRARDRRAAAAGWRVLRFGWQEVNERPALVVREISALIFRPVLESPTGPFAA